MSKRLSDYSNSRDNNFNLIRFIAAVFVLYSHSYPLTLGDDAIDPLGTAIGISLGGLAVDVFFLSSGFLIASSFFIRNNMLAFIWARLLRIYPALIVAIIFCVCVVGLYFTTDSLIDYFSDSQTYKFFKRNVTLFWGVKFHLPGVFEDNPYKEAINGSLWTLPYEIKMYTYLALIGSLLLYMQKKLNKIFINHVFLIMAIISLLMTIFNHFYAFMSIYFIHLFSLFFIGSAFYLYRDKIQLSHHLFFILLLFFVVTGLLATDWVVLRYGKDYFFIAYSLILPYMLFYLAYVPSGKIRSFNQLGDYSYGLYIYAFPVQQSIVALIPDISVLAMFILSFIISLFLAVLSWHFIEKRFLKMKGNYIIFEKVWYKFTKIS